MDYVDIWSWQENAAFAPDLAFHVKWETSKHLNFAMCANVIFMNVQYIDIMVLMSPEYHHIHNNKRPANVSSFLHSTQLHFISRTYAPIRHIGRKSSSDRYSKCQNKTFPWHSWSAFNPMNIISISPFVCVSNNTLAMAWPLCTHLLLMVCMMCRMIQCGNPSGVQVDRNSYRFYMHGNLMRLRYTNET